MERAVLEKGYMWTSEYTVLEVLKYRLRPNQKQDLVTGSYVRIQNVPFVFSRHVAFRFPVMSHFGFAEVALTSTTTHAVPSVLSVWAGLLRKAGPPCFDYPPPVLRGPKHTGTGRLPTLKGRR